jgi:tetratricopeptide (TPR) repeat protein
LRTPHYIALGAALALLAILYWGIPTTPPPGAKASGGGAHQDPGGKPAMPQVLPASTDSIMTASKALLPGHAVGELAAIEKKIAATSDSAAMAPLYEQAAALWLEHKQGPMAAFSRAKAAHLARSEKKLNFAGQFFLDLMHEATTPGMQAWEAQGAVDCLSEALKLNPDNDTTKLALASAYIEGGAAPMNGVTILREMVAKDPNHIPANLMLGRLSIQSGQFDKAVARLEHVMELEPQNREALYFLAEAYKGKGDKEKAIATLRKLEGIVNKPEFTKDIEAYITTFK